MKYVIISTLLKILSPMVRCQPSPEVNLVHRLNDFFCFDHNIFLLDVVKDHNRYIPVDDRRDGHVIPQTVYNFGHNNLSGAIHRKQLETLANVSGNNPFLIVVAAGAESLKFRNDTHILDEVVAIRQRMTNVKIGLFFENTISSMEILLQLFQWSWRNRILNIFCAFHSNNLSSFTQFRFDPFAANFLLNLTGSELLQNYFPEKMPNYHRHPLRLLGLYDVPVQPFGINFWQNVAGIFNASTSIIYTSVAVYEELKFSAINADVCAFEVNFNEDLKLYPQRRSLLVLLVPHSRPYSNIIVYLQSSTWTSLIAYTLAVIATASLLLILSGCWRANKEKSIFQCVVDVINLLINDNSAINYRRLHRADVYIVVPLTFTGLIVANGVLSVFKSYLTVPIYEHQVKTIEELYKSQLPILSDEVYWANATVEFLASLSSFSWREKILSTNFVRYLNELQTFNNSVAYSVLEKYVRVCLAAQKRLNFKAYYLITETFLAQYFATFDINPNFPFIEPINLIYHRLQSSGISEKWRRDIDENEIKKVTKANLSRQPKSDSDDDFGGGLATVVWCGWIASAILFICELIWNQIQPKIDKMKQTLWDAPKTREIIEGFSTH